MQQLAESGMDVLAATLEKILLKREEKRFSRSYPGEIETSPVGSAKNWIISPQPVNQKRSYQAGDY